MNNYLIMDYHFVYQEQGDLISLDNFIMEKKNELLEEVKLENDKGSSCNIFYDTAIREDIFSIHFILYIYTGGAHDIRYDRVFYYDLNDKKEVFLDDIIENKKDFFSVLSNKAKDKLLHEKKDLIYDDLYLLEDGLKPIEENFKYLFFDVDHLKVIFPPYQVGPWSSGEISVNIPYSDIDKYLKV